jgi:hypothetical protein
MYALRNIVTVETLQCILFVVELHVNVNFIKNIECCTTMLLWQVCRRQQQNVRRFTVKVSDAALQQKNVCFFMVIFRRTVWLNRW